MAGSLAAQVSAATTASATEVPASASPGCGSLSRVGPGEQTVPFAADHVSGWYIREVPAGYAGHVPSPAVIDLHGYDEPASAQALLSGLGDYGQVGGFVTITPKVQGAVPEWYTSRDGPEMRWFGSLLDDLESTLCIDQNRVFVTGYSDGAFFASAIACRVREPRRGGRPVAGIQAVAGCRPSRPVPVVAFHGTADPDVTYTGGIGNGVRNLPLPNGSHASIAQLLHDPAITRLESGESIPAMTAQWAARNGCGNQPSRTRIARDVILIRYPCPAAATTELYRIAGGGHTWPGSQRFEPLRSDLGRTTMSISADAIMWRFFEAHPLRPGG